MSARHGVEICGWEPTDKFHCDFCGETVCYCEGADDPVERYLGSADGGICSTCWSKLPEYVIEAAEENQVVLPPLQPWPSYPS